MTFNIASTQPSPPREFRPGRLRAKGENMQRKMLRSRFLSLPVGVLGCLVLRWLVSVSLLGAPHKPLWQSFFLAHLFHLGLATVALMLFVFFTSFSTRERKWKGNYPPAVREKGLFSNDLGCRYFLFPLALEKRSIVGVNQCRLVIAVSSGDNVTLTCL